MTVSDLLSSHVYTAILVGSLVEGETTVVLAGFAVHQGYASWWGVTLIAASVNFGWDQTYYILGRWRGDWVLDRLPRLRPGVERVMPVLHRHRRWFTFGVRFMYGLRAAGPLALGIARVSWRDFVLFNALGALVWAATFSTLGYVFGKALVTALGELSHYEANAAIAILVSGLAWFVIHRSRR